MNKIFSVIILMLLCAGSQAMSVCTKQVGDCDLYGEHKEGGVKSKFEIFSYNKLIATLASDRKDTWAVVKEGVQYYLVHRNSYLDAVDIYMFELGNVCDNCGVALLSGRYIFNIESFLEGDYTASSLGFMGVEKTFSKPYLLSDKLVFDDLIYTAIELPPLDAALQDQELNKYKNSKNIFYMHNFSVADTHLSYKILYLPPIKKESTIYLNVGCVENCGFIDSVLQTDGITYEFYGEINSAIPIKVELKKIDGKVTGKYCYLKNCNAYLSLSGTIKDGVIEVGEQEKNKITGAMKLNSSGEGWLSGDWISAAGKKMPILLVRKEQRASPEKGKVDTPLRVTVCGAEALQKLSALSH